MAHIIAKVKIRSALNRKGVSFDLLVDTGSTYTWLPSPLLKSLGITPGRIMRFESIDGKILKRSISEAVIEYLGRRVTTIVVFAQAKDAHVLGTYALEGLALEVDPVRKRLKTVSAVLAI